MLNNSTTKLLLLFFAALLNFTACDDDEDPDLVNEEELITDVTYTLSPTTGTGDVVFSFSDPDGDGGVDGTSSQTGTLRANTTYNGVLRFENTNEPPVENITEEVIEEDEDHQVFFTQTGTPNLSISYADADGDGNPLGVQTTLTTGASGNGSMTIILRHEPVKGAAAVIDNPVVAGGESDVEVNFSVQY